MSLFSFGFKKVDSGSTPKVDPAKVVGGAAGKGTAEKNQRIAEERGGKTQATAKTQRIEEDEEDALMCEAAQKAELAMSGKRRNVLEDSSEEEAEFVEDHVKSKRLNGHLTKKTCLEAPSAGKEAKNTQTLPKKRKSDEFEEDKSEEELSMEDSSDEEEYAASSKKKKLGAKKLIKKNRRKEESESEIDSSSQDDDDDDDDEEEEEEEKPAKPARKLLQSLKTPAKTPASKASGVKTPASHSSGSLITPAKSSLPPSPIHGVESPTATGDKQVLSCGEHEHNRLPWLQPDQIQDKNGRRASDPKYDPSTLHVPQGYFDGKPAFHAAGSVRKITPALTCWWQFKSEYGDAILFYKVGKFYEIYHMDADVAVRHLGLVYMKGDVAHCGFPEKAYGKFSEQLVDVGYRVARVEQVETPEMQKARSGKASGMVKREVCGMLSKGTRIMDVRDGLQFDTQVHAAVVLVSIFEDKDTIGVCVLDSTTGRFKLGQFADGGNRSRLRMLLSRENPAEIAFGRSNVSEVTLDLLRQGYPQVLGVQGTVVHSPLPVADSCGKEAKEAVHNITKTGYFKDAKFPAHLKALIEGFQKQEASHQQAALAALGVCLRLLTRSKVDFKLVSMGEFYSYELPGTETDAPRREVGEMQQSDPLHTEKMVLDSQAIFNLDLLPSSTTSASEDGSLLAFLDKCVTKFGKRMLRQWVAAPLQSPKDIRARQRMVAALVDLHLSEGSVLLNLRNGMKLIPDMERTLQRIHAIGVKDQNHPDSRAVLYDLQDLNKSKIACLVDTLAGARMAIKVIQDLERALQALQREGADKCTEIAAALQRLCEVPLAEWSRVLDEFERSFDQKAAKLSGNVIPRQRGLAPEYDHACDEVERIKESFQGELEKARAFYRGKGNVNQVVFWNPNTGKDLFQIEVPNQLLSKGELPSNTYTMKSKTKSATRYHTSAIVSNLASLSVAEAALEETRGDMTRLVFEAFDSNRSIWLSLVAVIRELDCLISLALVSGFTSEDSPMCRPEILEAESGQAPVLELREAKHPCVAQILERAGKSYIPNDIVLGGTGQASVMLLTGPNMGGKSSLCRQTAIAVVMAQMGCFVSARSFRLTPVDRVFTRLGASDFIMSGKSTFFVELDETATVLHNATKRSLVILDELGRGTSTHDGAAIAYSVVEFLTNLDARTMFATHYHALVEEFALHPKVKSAHMACFAAPRDGDNEDTVKTVDITFLYKLEDGPSDKSHGLNVARLARLPDSIIATAQLESEHFERDFVSLQIFEELRNLLKGGSADPAKLARLHKRATSIHF